MSFIGKLFGGGGSSVAPTPAPTPAAAPSVATPAVQAAADAARVRERAASGRASTMLTAQSDTSSLTPTTARATLGGKITDEQRMGTAKLLGR